MTIWILVIAIAVIGGGVGTWLFLKNNPNKAKKIDEVVDVIKK